MLNTVVKAIWICAPAVIISAFSACSARDKETYAPQPVADVASVMYDYRSLPSDTRDSLVARYRPEITAFMKTVSEDSVDNILLESWSASMPVAVFTPAVDSVYSTLSNLEEMLGYTLGKASALGLNLPKRRYAAVVYGRPESVLFVDSVMLVALNHYLGADYPGYSHWPVYMRLGKSPENMPYDIAEALVATSYPYSATGDDNTLLAAMLYQGALAHARRSLVREGRPGTALGYDDLRMKKLHEEEGAIWRSLVENKLLYTTSEREIDRMTAPSPYVMIAGTQWPSRAGRYIGYRIVESYLSNNPDTPLSFFLSPDFYLSSDVLQRARYNP